MRVLLLPVVLMLAFLSGWTGAGPAKDAVAILFTARSEMALMRAEIADLRIGRGSLAPSWVRQYAVALCSGDAAYVMRHTDVAALGMTEADVVRQFDRMHTNGLDCARVRYLGSVGQSQFVFVLDYGIKDIWYVLTLSADGNTIAKVE